LENLIAHIKRYVPLDQREEAALPGYVNLFDLKKKEYLLKEGQVCKSLYFVEKGCLRLFYINDKGVEQIIQFAIENWWMSDYMSFTLQKPSGFYIQTVEKSTIFSLDQKEQDALCKQFPQMERYFRLILQRAYAASQYRLRYLADLSKEESYRHFIADFPGFAQRIPQYMLASYLGLTPEYLSEIRKKQA
jgi:CRP-like cAMP-binding protein